MKQADRLEVRMELLDKRLEALHDTMSAHNAQTSVIQQQVNVINKDQQNRKETVWGFSGLILTVLLAAFGGPFINGGGK